MPGLQRAKTAYWIFTILFCLMMGFTEGSDSLENGVHPVRAARAQKT